MNAKRIYSNILLVITAFIWGTAFVAQRVGMDHIQPFTFNAVRNIVASIALLPVIYITNSKNKRINNDSKERGKLSDIIIGGILCGIALFVGSAFQQIGIIYTTVGKSGFITALYIVLVPVLGIFIKKKIPMKVWVSVVIALVGLYLLCINEGFTINKGDLLTLGCAVAFSFHILVIDYFSPKVDGIKMSCIQFVVCGIISLIVAIIEEEIQVEAILAAIVPILYTGVLSSSVGYTLQIIAQKNTDPTIASLIMSLESVFALLAGWIILNQRLVTKEILGCVLVFIAIVITQIPERKLKK